MAKKTQEQLINNIIGQMNGINKMINDKKDCFLVINQFKAVRSAVDSIMNIYIEDNFKNCMKNTKSRERINKLLNEIIKNN